MAWAYDAERNPDAELWLTLDESERLDVVLAHHQALGNAHANLANPQAHAAMHVVIENQLAEDNPFAARVTLKRLMDGGLNRHEAIHAMGIVASKRLFAVLKNKEKWDADAYIRDLNALDAKTAFGSVRPKN